MVRQVVGAGVMGRALYWAHRFVQWLGDFSRPREDDQ